MNREQLRDACAIMAEAHTVIVGVDDGSSKCVVGRPSLPGCGVGVGRGL